jgi:hypothetical protein
VEDALERMPECSDVIRTFYEARSRFKEIAEKDKEMKFTNQIKMDEMEVKEAVVGVDMNNMMDEI